MTIHVTELHGLTRAQLVTREQRNVFRLPFGFQMLGQVKQILNTDCQHLCQAESHCRVWDVASSLDGLDCLAAHTHHSGHRGCGETSLLANGCEVVCDLLRGFVLQTVCRVSDTLSF